MSQQAKSQKRVSIYLTPPVQRVIEQLPEDQSLTHRLAVMSERYELICGQTPPLSPDEHAILAQTLSGTFIDPLLIQHLDQEIADSDEGDPAAIAQFAERVTHMSYADRVAMIESLGR